MSWCCSLSNGGSAYTPPAPARSAAASAIPITKASIDRSMEPSFMLGASRERHRENGLGFGGRRARTRSSYSRELEHLEGLGETLDRRLSSPRPPPQAPAHA